MFSAKERQDMSSECITFTSLKCAWVWSTSPPWALVPVRSDSCTSRGSREYSWISGISSANLHWLSLLEIHWIDRVVVTLLCGGLRSVLLCSHTPQQVIDMKILKLKEMPPRNWVPACIFVCFINERGLHYCDDERSVPWLSTSCFLVQVALP